MLNDRFGGAGILAGSGNQGTRDSLTLTNSIVTDNHASPPSADFTGQPGGGVQMAGGNLTVTNCTFTNNTSASSQGGAIAYISPEFGGTVTITGSSFSGNGMTNTATSGSTGGGAIYINNALSSPNTTTINNSTFTNNSAAGSALTGTTYGGAIYINTGVLNIDHSTFRGNSSTGNGGQGGAIYVDSGTLSLQYSRLVGNSAPNGGSGVYNHSTNGAATTATNNWWGCNAGPAAAGCDQAAADGAGLTAAPWIVLSNTANPASIYVGEATTLTASFLQNSAGATLSTAQVSLLLGSPVTWNNAVLGSLSAQVLSIQPDGKATATFTAGMVNGAGQATATVDNGAATAGITILPIADLVVTKTSPPSAAVGSNLTYTVSVTNNGPNGAQNVTLTDALPTGTSFVSQSQTGGTDLFTLGRSGNTIANTIANLPAGATATFQFVTNVAANLPDASVLSNTASVSAASRDPNSSNNSSTATTSVFASADLVVTKTSPPAVAAGTDLTYTVSLTNNGPSDARTVTLTDTLPNGTSFVSQSQTGGADLFTLGRTGNTITNTIANLPAGATVTFQFVTNVSAALPDGSSLSNTASVSAVTDDPNSSNNASTAGTSLANSADLVVSKTSPPTVTAGTDLTYTVMVTNIGPSGAENVQLSDPLPTGTSFVSQSQTGGADLFTLGRTGNTITNTIASLPAGATATFQIVARVSAGQPAFSMLGNTASIIAATDDPNSNNNSSTATTAVTTSADLVVTKTSPASVTAGSNLTYTLSVTNNGPSDAASISLTDTLPAETSFVAQSQTGGADLFTLGNIGNTIGNSIASLPAGATATFEILTKVSANRPDASQLSNTAIVSAASFDPNGSNNSSTAGTTVFASADLAVTKSGPALVTAGGSLTYTVSLTNNGPSDAQGVTVLDTLPTGTAFTSQIQTLGPNFILSNAGNAVQNTIPSLAAGASASFSISASVDSGLAGGSTLTNSATAASTTSDLNPANNSASSAATVNRPPAFTSADSTTFTVGVAGTFTVSASGYPTPALSETGALPGGVTFVDNGNGTATLSGMPAAGSGGTYILTLSASNGIGTDAAQTFTLTVYPLPEITSGNATTFTVGMPGTFTVIATGVPTPSLSLTGALPGGVTFVDNGNGTATLSGTPAHGTVNVYPLTITAHNTSGVDYNQSFTLTVQKADFGCFGRFVPEPIRVWANGYLHRRGHVWRRNAYRPGSVQRGWAADWPAYRPGGRQRQPVNGLPRGGNARRQRSLQRRCQLQPIQYGAAAIPGGESSRYEHCRFSCFWRERVQTAGDDRGSGGAGCAGRRRALRHADVHGRGDAARYG